MERKVKVDGIGSSHRLAFLDLRQKLAHILNVDQNDIFYQSNIYGEHFIYYQQHSNNFLRRSNQPNKNLIYQQPLQYQFFTYKERETDLIVLRIYDNFLYNNF